MAADIVDIEKVLNSRCSSELDIDSRKSHWGTLINKRPSEEAIDQILRCCNTPRFSDGKLLQWFENESLFLGFEKPENQHEERLLHIESGMQQEAVYLACAALGIGTYICNQGLNGTQYGEKAATARLPIMEMIDPYESGNFTTKAPGPEKSFKTGKNLMAPVREGDVECLPNMGRLTSFNKSGSPATEKDISQLLWAAKGRTPHCIKVDRWNLMWGLTIPTWGGGQNYTSVYLLKNKKLYNYMNWTKEFSLMNRLFREKFRWTRGNPTHDIRFFRNANISSQMDGHEEAIVLCQNEHTARALWEIGYMLENMFLQAKSLGISYESKVFSADKASQLYELGMANAVAAIFI
jgi:hypothetical protein